MQGSVPSQLAVMHSDAIRGRASKATPPKVRVLAGCLAAGGALQLARHRAVIKILLACLLRCGPSPRVLGGTLLCH